MARKKRVATEPADSSLDIWRKVPPEEKLTMVARAQASGTAASLTLLTVFGTLAVGFKTPWVFWSAFAAVPLIFQYACSKAWRDIKPRAMLEYLAARSAARRYAYGVGSQSLSVSLIFRGYLRRLVSAEQLEFAIQPEFVSVPVWVALFPDAVVMMSEGKKGARLEFSHLLDSNMETTAIGFDGGDDRDRHVKIGATSKGGTRYDFELTSDYPAALLAFDQKGKVLRQVLIDEAARQARACRELFTAAAGEEEGDFTSASFG